MSISNSYTLKEYKQQYTILLEKHKLEYEDFDEYTFIDKEIKIFQKGLLLDLEFDLEFEQDFDFDEITLDPILNFDANGNLSQHTYEKIEGATRRTIEYIGDAQKHNLSSSLIINFLEQRNKELEKKSMITLEIENNLIPIQAEGVTETVQPKEILPKKTPEKWHALHYWFEVTAHGIKTPFDPFGGYVKTELERIGAERCNSTGTMFYKDFRKININDPKSLERQFGKSWKEYILQMFVNDTITIDYINEKYT